MVGRYGKNACEQEWRDTRPGVDWAQVMGGPVGMVRVLSFILSELDMDLVPEAGEGRGPP